jgi:hypothetical protein
MLAEDDDKGKQWLACCYIRLGRKPVVCIVPAESDPGKHTTWLKKGVDPNKRDLRAVTYVRFTKSVLIGKGSFADGSAKVPRRTINLLHDRDGAHNSKAAKSFAAHYNVNAVLLPPRSPDLNPLDYGVFGPAQKKLDRAMEERRLSWEEQCAFLETALKDADTDAAIKVLPGRIARCIAAKGGHFE